MVVKIETPGAALSIGDRLRIEMRKLGISSAELARRANLKTSFLYDVMSGKSANPSTVKLARVADELGVSLSYLAGSADHGGSAFIPVDVQQSGDYVTVQRLMVDTSSGAGVLVSRFKNDERYYFRREWIEKHLGVTPADLRILFVRGDSMEPTLSHNDIILVDTTKKLPSPPGVFVLYDGFGLMPKRLEYLSADPEKMMRIISDNPQYSTYERAIDETVIIGRVVWFAREI